MCDILIGWFSIEIEVAEYADSPRAITTPLLLMDLLLTASMPWPTVLYTILLNEVMVVTGLIGALVQSSYKVRLLSLAVAPVV